MMINGVDMEKACELKFKAYVKEIEDKNGFKVDEESLENLRKIHVAGFSSALEVLFAAAPSTKKKG